MRWIQATLYPAASPPTADPASTAEQTTMEIQRILALQYSGYTLSAFTLYLLGQWKRRKGSWVALPTSAFVRSRFQNYLPRSSQDASEVEAKRR
jgi:hypothetical protein